ncbi:LysR substrate-binding domain-containing protein [Azospirillum sp.]|uniref:LysR substrate-binding domain-containing protein n=1 Tax=Azospirillum sp. TaxID=34012 RepID=UPI002D552F93|nr:LysR substrate-binding domain-containing protein [Azospirillum sp.]HYF89533.1 LysR substrate-binding domain-containing protein [Azospirillum sp.]
MRFDLITLKLFVAVGEEANLTRAAERENIVLSAASKRIADLEASVGIALLRRHARGVTLTPAGQTFLHYSWQVLQTLARMEGELSDFTIGVKGHVRMHAIASAISEFLPRELNGFLTRYPMVKIDLEEQVGPAIVRAVADRSADIGIITENTAAEGLERLPYHVDRLVLVVPDGHPLAERPAVRMMETLDYDFIGPHPDSSLLAVIMRASMETGSSIKLRIQVRSFDGMCRMIEENLGIGILPSMAIEHQIAAGRIRAIPLAEAWATRRLFLCVRDTASLPVSARQLVQHLAAAAEQPA